MVQIRHLVFLQWKPERDAQFLEQIRFQLMDLVHHIPNIHRLDVYHLKATDGAINADGFNTVLDSVLDSVDALMAYGPHPAHQAVVNSLIKPNLQQIFAVDYSASDSVDVARFSDYQQAHRVRRLIAFKPKADAEIELIVSQMLQMANALPHLVSSNAGCQSLSNLPDTFNDRSGGRHVCLELTFADAASLEAAPKDVAYLKLSDFVNAHADDSVSIRAFDYLL